MKKEYLIASWWIYPEPRKVKVVPEVKEFISEEEAREEGRKRKKQLGSGSKVKIAKVIETL